MTAETLSPEERAHQIIPPNYRAETAQTCTMPSMMMVLSSRSAGALRDAIAQAIHTAEAAAEQRGYARGQADAWEDCARVAGNAERGWNARIALKGRIGDSDVYASGAANAAGEIAAAIRARSTTSEEGGRNG